MLKSFKRRESYEFSTNSVLVHYCECAKTTKTDTRLLLPVIFNFFKCFVCDVFRLFSQIHHKTGSCR